MFGQGVNLGLSVSGFGGGAVSAFSRGIRGLGGASTKTARGVGFLTSTAWGLTRAVGAFSAGVGLAGVGAFAALGRAGIGLNNTLESTRLGMAATIGANLKFADSFGHALNASDSFSQSMKVSSNLIKDFEARALKLPGSSTELSNLFSAALNPSLSAGKSLKDITDLSAGAMTFAKVIKNDIPQASRDLQLLLTGNAGTDNRTWSLINSNIGMTAQQFNKLPKPERFELLGKAFKNFATPEIVNAYANSWDGLTSSFQDLLDQGTRAFGAPLFKEFKGLLSDSIGFLSNNKTEVQSFATTLGSGLAGGVRAVVSVGGKLFNVLGNVWGQVKGLMPSGKSLNVFFDDLATTFGTVAVAAFQIGVTIWKAVSPIRTALGGILKDGFNKLSAWFTQNQAGISQFGQELASGAVWAWEGIKKLVGGFSSLWNQISGFLPTGQQVIEWASNTWQTVSKAGQELIAFGQSIWNDISPAVAYFTKIGRDGFALVSGWITKNRDKIDEASAGFKSFVSVAVKITAWATGFIALGFVTVLGGIARAGIELFAGFRKGLAFVESLPNRAMVAFDRWKVDILKWGIDTTNRMKGIPIFGALLGIGDKAFGVSSNMQSTIKALEKDIQQKQDQIISGDPTNPAAQYGASRRLGALMPQPANAGALPPITVNNYIQSNDPRAAGQAASNGTQSAIQKAISPAVSKPARNPGLRTTAPNP
jgi:hypothetical protein